MLGCLLSRIRQYCDVQQSVSLSGWWAVPLGAVDTVYSVDTVYFAISGALCSISDLVLANRREVWRNTKASRGFVTSCRVLANNASLHSSRLLCWFKLPRDIGCGLNSLLYLPPSSGQLRGVSSVAAEEEHERGDSSYHTSQLMSFIRREYRASEVPLTNGEIDPDPAYFDEFFLGPGFAAMLSVSQDAASCALGSFVLASLDSSRALGSSPSVSSPSIPPSPPVADPQPAVGQAITCNIIQESVDFDTTDEVNNEVNTIREGNDFNTTDEVNTNQVATDEVADYSQVVIMPRVQQRRLLTLLAIEQGLSMLTPNNPTSASFVTAEFIPFSAWYSQRWIGI